MYLKQKGAHTQAGDSWLTQAGLFLWLTQAGDSSAVFIMTNSAKWINRESELIQLKGKWVHWTFCTPFDFWYYQDNSMRAYSKFIFVVTLQSWHSNIEYFSDR